jgi:hypothetical protein
VADIITQASAEMPKVLRSFAVLNLAWTSLGMLLTAIPQPWRPVLPDKALVAQVLQCALGWLQQELQQLASVHYDGNRLKVGRHPWQHHAQRCASYACCILSS